MTKMASKKQRLPSNFIQMEPSDFKKNKLDAILDKLKSKKILVAGDVGLDRYTVGSVDRISPEAPVPIVFVQEEKLKLGLAANVADNIHALGAKSHLVGIVGNDRAAKDFKMVLRQSGIAPSFLITDATRRTVLKERIVSDRQQLLRVDYENSHALSQRIQKNFLLQITKALKKSDALILEDYAKGTLSAGMCKKIYALARKSQKTVSVDPNARSQVSLYEGVDLLTPNTKEAQALSGIKIVDLKSLSEAGKKLLKQTGASHVIITRGREGMALFSKSSEKVKLIPTYAREVYDVSGAGDTVIAVLTLALSAGATIEEACVLANLAAAVEVGKRGTATVSVSEIRAEMKQSFFWG